MTNAMWTSVLTKRLVTAGVNPDEARAIAAEIDVTRPATTKSMIEECFRTDPDLAITITIGLIIGMALNAVMVFYFF